jgi:hypothetical protein
LDDVLVDGVSIEAGIRHISLVGWGDMHATPAFKGDNYDVPGRPGQVWRTKTHDVGVASLNFSITSAATDLPGMLADANTEWARILRMFPRRRPVNLTRVLGMRDDQGQRYEVRQVARAELAESIAPNWETQSFQRGVLTFRLLDGYWFSEDPITYTVLPGQTTYLPAPGTTDTSNMTIVLSGGTDLQRLTNTSADVWMYYDWSAPVDPASVLTIDVPNFTATRRVGGATFNSVGRIRHSGDERFMLIDPDLGDNAFTITSGKAVITYRGAWL